MMFPSEPHRQLQVKGPESFPGSIIKKLVTLEDRTEFKFGIELFKTDDDFKTFYLEKGSYLVAFKIFSVDSIVTSFKLYVPSATTIF